VVWAADLKWVGGLCAVYQPPMVSTHYDLALSGMGLAG